MKSAADQFLESLEIPNFDMIMIQLNETKEKLRDTESILAVLREVLETTMQLPEGRDREVLRRELENNINRQKLLIERESIKLSVKEKYLKDVMNREIPEGNTASSNGE